ncbi:MAG TPA: glycosyltransferase family 2 protein [Solirubrobacteraceae bacterium]|nr:glycosyltransferase family 2 protein [Solirubrobacteraceae bacterium]
MNGPSLTVLVPVLNEFPGIGEVVAALETQSFEGPLEFLLLDGGSTDGTRAVLEELARRDARFRVLDNPAGHIPAALNLGLRHARGEFVARMDAHTLYPPDYLACGVARLRRGDAAWATGPALAHGEGTWSRRVALALTTWMGIGAASFRRPASEEIETDTGFTGVMRRRTLEALGGWDERSLVNEDAELAARVRAAGGRIVCLPQMAARYVPRDRLSALARQYFRYGRFRARTSGLHPESMRPSHVLAPGIVLAAGAAVVAPAPLARPARALLAAYGLAVVVASGRAAANGKPADAAALPVVFATMHLSWGAGFLAGCARFGVPLAALARVARAAAGLVARAPSRFRPRRRGR